MSMLTIGWDRAENAADLPRDSGIVFAPSPLTIQWRPMLNSAVLDWDAADMGAADPGRDVHAAAGGQDTGAAGGGQADPRV